MNRHPLLLIGFLCGFALLLSKQAAAQTLTLPPSGKTAPKIDRADLGKLLDQYATVAGGWYLEQRCHHLADNLKSEFDWNVEQTNIALQRQTDSGLLRQLQQAARKVAESKTCGKETSELVVATLAMSRRTVNSLTGQTYSPAAGLQRNAQRIQLLLMAQKLDNKCKSMPKEIRKEFDGRIFTIVADFTRLTGSSTLDRIEKAATDAFQKNDFTCDQKAEAALKDSLLEARQMSPSWQAK